jgi:hypothetical protein
MSKGQKLRIFQNVTTAFKILNTMTTYLPSKNKCKIKFIKN